MKKIFTLIALAVMALAAQAEMIDGHEYVDLGLPSGTLWATCNMGADTPEGYGGHFAWGETEAKDVFDNNYKWLFEGKYTKYCTDSDQGYNGFTDGKTELDPEDDAAYINWGTSWRIPTEEQQKELMNNCYWEMTTINGVNGRLGTGPNGNSIFLPAAGLISSWSNDQGSGAAYSSRNIDELIHARFMGFDSDYLLYSGGSARSFGFSIRAVVEINEPPTPPTPGIIPANPTADSWYDCGDESGFSRFYFTLPTTDVNGAPLDKENLSYAVWINDGNGEVYQFTFPAEVYIYDLDEDINEVPYYLYTTGYDFYEDHVYFYRTNEPGYEPLFVRDEDHDGNIGIQVFYTTDRAKTQSEIAWLYEVTPEPPTPTEKTEAPTFNGYTTDGIHAYFVEILESEPSAIYYRVQYPDGIWTDWGEYEDILTFTENGSYVVEAYAVAPGKLPSDENSYEFAVGPSTGMSELMNGKAVASVRYYNMAGQEMPQANGMTIVVTTYTDGTTNAVKVIK
ncbi:MAG: hypothetical protein IKX18_08765 [Muribaculaceae bacterium]|nr:hypothetical protein [Muribaculaceae bacterium]